jgi:hypothetical protein
MTEHVPEHLMDLNKGVKDTGPEHTGAFLEADDHRSSRGVADVEYGTHRLGDEPDPDSQATEDEADTYG